MLLAADALDEQARERIFAALADASLSDAERALVIALNTSDPALRGVAANLLPVLAIYNDAAISEAIEANPDLAAYLPARALDELMEQITDPDAFREVRAGMSRAGVLALYDPEGAVTAVAESATSAWEAVSSAQWWEDVGDNMLNGAEAIAGGVDAIARPRGHAAIVDDFSDDVYWAREAYQLLAGRDADGVDAGLRPIVEAAAALATARRQYDHSAEARLAFLPRADTNPQRLLDYSARVERDYEAYQAQLDRFTQTVDEVISELAGHSVREMEPGDLGSVLRLLVNETASSRLPEAGTDVAYAGDAAEPAAPPPPAPAAAPRLPLEAGVMRL